MALGHGSKAGGALRSVRVDDAGRSFSNPGADRAQDQSYEASVNQHVETTRWTYTVAAGKMAVLELLHAYAQASAVINEVSAAIEILPAAGGTIDIFHVQSNLTSNAFDTVGCAVVLHTGDAVRGVTINANAAARELHVAACIREIDL